MTNEKEREKSAEHSELLSPIVFLVGKSVLYDGKNLGHGALIYRRPTRIGRQGDVTKSMANKRPRWNRVCQALKQSTSNVISRMHAYVTDTGKSYYFSSVSVFTSVTKFNREPFCKQSDRISFFTGKSYQNYLWFLITLLPQEFYEKTFITTRFLLSMLSPYSA